jgi:uncharacterized protein YtpQ (UPF0354 family)
MWPWSKKPTTTRTSRAIAYLKVDSTNESDTGPALQLTADDAPILKDLGNGLLIAYVIDEGAALRYVAGRNLRDDGVTADELHTIGLANLKNLAATKPLRVQPYQDIFAVLVDGNFEASMLLLDELWESHFQQFVTGDYLVALPTRDVLSFCDAASATGREQLLQLVERLRNSTDHPLSQSIYRRVGNRWERKTDL